MPYQSVPPRNSRLFSADDRHCCRFHNACWCSTRLQHHPLDKYCRSSTHRNGHHQRGKIPVLVRRTLDPPHRWNAYNFLRGVRLNADHDHSFASLSAQKCYNGETTLESARKDRQRRFLQSALKAYRLYWSLSNPLQRNRQTFCRLQINPRQPNSQVKKHHVLCLEYR